VIYGELPLEDVREFFSRHIVVEPYEADAIALWIAHTYVYETARATPYIYFCSPDPGSGKQPRSRCLQSCARGRSRSTTSLAPRSSA
jgi:hypothetical protein